MSGINLDEITPAPVLGAGNAKKQADHGKTAFEPFALEPLTAEELEKSPEASKFSFSLKDLQRLVEARHHAALSIFGGITGLAAGLRTDLKAGLGVDEDILAETKSKRDANDTTSTPTSRTSSPGNFTSRRACFGENRTPHKEPKTFLQLLWLAFNDKLMFLLTGSAAVSLSLGIYQTVHHGEDDGPSIEWVEGVAILVAVIIIVLATALNDLAMNHKFQKLNQKREERNVQVTRSGKECYISVYDLVVGDILHVEAGDVVPADAVVIHASEIQCDESTLTGESELIEKEPAVHNHGDQLLLSGTTVVTGVGSCLVIAVGVNSTYGRLIMSLEENVQVTPLQQKLGRLAKYIIKCGLTAGIIFFIIQFSRFLARLDTIEGGSEAKGQAFLEVLILAITVIIIVVPEGLPLTVTIALAFATTRMLRDKNLVRSLRSCETMGNATTVCSDKTGTLTQNNMTVVTGIVGTSTTFGELFKQPGTDVTPALTLNNLNTELSVDTVDLLKAGAVVNSTARESDVPGEFIGSSTETSLLKFAQTSLGMDTVSIERNKADIVHMIPFDARRKWMAVVIKLNSSQYRFLVKGAREVIISQCKTVLAHPQQGLSVAPLSPEDAIELNSIVSNHAASHLRVVATAFKDFDECHLDDSAPLSNVDLHALFSDLTFIGAFGIRDPLRSNVAESVRQCQDAGVFVRMVTGDNFLTAKSVASECHIYTPGGIAMDGQTFRRLTSEQLDLIAARIQVLARSSPDDKKRLVSHLQGLKEIVAVTGDGTNDAPALKSADIGFSMGISGTEVAKEASDIILMDDNFASIVKAISWGRAINDATKKFLQFQFTINITAGALTMITALISGAEEAVFTIVQLLWINLLMDTFASLALSTDYPNESVLHRRPEPRHAGILNTTAWKMIVGQSVYQVAVMFTLHYAGYGLFGAETEEEQRRVQTMIFNAYVFMQFFNQSNCRRADNHLNIFEGVFRNPWFFVVQAVTLGGQIAIVFVGGEAFETAPLTPAMWGWSMLLGIITWPLGVVLRLIPDEIVRGVWLFIKKALSPIGRLLRRSPKDDEEEAHGSLSTGWRTRVLQALRIKKRSSRSDISISTGMAALPTSNSQDQLPIEPFDLEAAIEASRHSVSAPFAGFEIHPGTLKDDPILDRECRSNGSPPSQDPQLRRYMGFEAASAHGQGRFL